MATEHGAATTPFADSIGRLEPGRRADFVVINHTRALYPYQDAIIPTLDAIMQRAKHASVDATVIAGVTVYKDGKFTQIDRDQILREIAETLSRPRTEAEAALIPFSTEMQSFVKTWYANYFDPSPHTSFYKQSSRL
jgi:hypothetical protein